MKFCNGRECYNKFGTSAQTLAFYSYCSSHFFYDLLTNTKSESCSLIIESLGVSQFAKVMKQFANIVLLDTYPAVFNSDFKWKIEVLFLIYYLILLNLSLVIIVLNILNFLVKILRCWPDNHRNFPLWWCKFKSIGQKVYQNLGISSFIPIYIFKKRQQQIVNLDNLLDLFFIAQKSHVFKSKIDCLR